MSNLFDLTGKTALITGSSKGIGKAIAEEMARHGAQVVISSRKSDVCESVAESIMKSPLTHPAVPFRSLRMLGIRKNFSDWWTGHARSLARLISWFAMLR